MKLSSVHRAGLASVLFENLTSECGFVIGRADKRYTLWKYAKSENSLEIAYVQVLSNKRHRVETRFPDIYICEELRGEHRMTFDRHSAVKSAVKNTAPKTIFDFAEIPFGEIRGMKITEADEWAWIRFANNGDFKWTDAYGTEFDFEPLVMQKLNEFGCKKVGEFWCTPTQLENPKRWMYLANTTLIPEHKAEYDAMCESLGLTKLMGRWFPTIALDGEKPWMTTARQILPAIENGDSFSFVPHFNGNDFFFGIPVKFREEDKKDVYTYYGSSHMLCITNKKGVKVAKRTKGKTIEVLEYEVLTDADNNPYVMVNKFNIK